MNKFQVIALEMEKIGFRSLPNDVTVNGEFECFLRQATTDCVISCKNGETQEFCRKNNAMFAILERLSAAK